MTTLPLPLLSPHSDQWTEPYPAWVTGFRPWQWKAAREIVAAFDRVDIVVLDAPTGSGKTLIAEMVARLMHGAGVKDEHSDEIGAHRLYVCSDKSLQAQFSRDYPEAKVLMGRANYGTLYGTEGITAADCNQMEGFCTWCHEDVRFCDYQIAKREAKLARCAVLNTSYLLSECNGPGEFRGSSLCVIDEADTLESQLMRHVTFELASRTAEGLGIVEGDIPKKGSHMPTIVTWLQEELIPKVRGKLLGVRGDSVSAVRERKRLERLSDSAAKVARQLNLDSSLWVRDNHGRSPLVLRPIVVDQYADDYLWRHHKKFLLMSATVVSADEMMGSLGKSREDFEVVKCPMTFPIENRQVVIAPIANMSAKAKQWSECAKAVVAICEEHSGDRVLVHGVSYELCARMAHEVQSRTTRQVFTHTNAGGRDIAIERYRAHEGSVLISPSLERGLDLRGDDCRVVIVCKVPFLYLADAQVNARMHRGREGEMWYAVQAIRTMVQMTGRGVRSADDWAVSYILDSQFMSNIWGKRRQLLPSWWVEALDMKSDNRWLR